MERSKVLAALSALAHDRRLELVRLLMDQGEAGLAAGVIGERLGLGASKLSFHLAALEQAGLIRSRRASRNVIYAVDLRGMGGTIAYLLKDCCRDHPDVLACCAPTAGPAPER
jgi:ArsR family transcriptional regulator, arsenate/arsenite/antimonite-responsive transcriptional repressor